MSDGSAFEATLRAARAGAEWAWRDLYAAFAPRLTGYARACRVADPEDLVGDVFLRAVRSLHRFEGGEGDLRAWLFALARNAVIDERRRATRRRTEPLPPEVLAELGPAVDAEQEAMRAMAEERVRAVLAPLTADQRDVLLLRILGGLTIEEVAAALGKRPGAVKALQARALNRIRRDVSRGAVTL